MSRCFRSFVQPSSTPVSKFISNHPSLYLLVNKDLQMLLAQVIIRMLSGSRNPEIAVDLFVQMSVVCLSMQPGGLTYRSVFKDYTQVGVVKDGTQLHGRVVISGLEFDRFIRNMMFSMYADCGILSEARKLFDENEVVDVVAWDTMITGYAICGKIADSRKLFDTMQLRNEALDLFNEMQDQRIETNESTLVSLLNASANLGAYEEGMWFHAYMKMHNVIVITALINMYCRCGDIKTSYRVFEDTTLGYDGFSCWNTIIMGLATNGFQHEAIQLYSRFLQPDSVSFIDVLTACNNSGLMNELKNYFAIMKTVYNIEPLSHYGCMIGTLGRALRAGRLEEAEHLTKQMPMNPDATRYHKNVKLARRADEKLAQLETDESGSSTLMSNAYAASSHFGEISNEGKQDRQTTRMQYN